MPSERKVKAGEAYVLIQAMDDTAAGLKKIGGKLKDWGRSMSRIGTQGMMAAGVMSLPFITGAREAMNFTDEVLHLRAVLGSSEREIKGLEARIRELGRTTSYTAAEVARSATALGKGGFSSKEVKDSLQAVLDLARTGRMSMDEAATVMVRAIRVFNMTASEASEVSDKFFMAAKSGTATIKELAQAFSFSAGTGNEMNFTIDEMLAILPVMANKMLHGTKGGTSLNQMLLRLGTRAEAVKEKLGFDVADQFGEMRSPIALLQDLSSTLMQLSEMERITVAEEIFNVRGERAVLAIANGISQIRENLSDLRYKSGGAVRRASQMLDSQMGGAIRKTKSAVNDLAIALGKSLGDTIEGISKSLIPFLNKLSAWVAANKKIAVAGAKLVAVIGGLSTALAVLGYGTTGIGMLITNIGVVTKLLGGLLAFLTSGPVGGLIAAIGLLATGIATVATNMRDMGPAGKEAEDAMKKLADAKKKYQGEEEKEEKKAEKKKKDKEEEEAKRAVKEQMQERRSRYAKGGDGVSLPGRDKSFMEAYPGDPNASEMGKRKAKARSQRMDRALYFQDQLVKNMEERAKKYAKGIDPDAKDPVTAADRGKRVQEIVKQIEELKKSAPGTQEERRQRLFELNRIIRSQKNLRGREITGDVLYARRDEYRKLKATSDRLHELQVELKKVVVGRPGAAVAQGGGAKILTEEEKKKQAEEAKKRKELAEDFSALHNEIAESIVQRKFESKQMKLDRERQKDRIKDQWRELALLTRQLQNTRKGTQEWQQINDQRTNLAKRMEDSERQSQLDLEQRRYQEQNEFRSLLSDLKELRVLGDKMAKGGANKKRIDQSIDELKGRLTKMGIPDKTVSGIMRGDKDARKAAWEWAGQRAKDKKPDLRGTPSVGMALKRGSVAAAISEAQHRREQQKLKYLAAIAEATGELQHRENPVMQGVG